jgi:CRP-like cAMP-binding protein
MEKSDLLVTLKADIETSVSRVPDADWNRFVKQTTELSLKKNSVIFRQTEICREVLYITDGITASEYVVDGRNVIVRFFLKGNFCTNLISAMTTRAGYENIISITPVQALSIPLNIFFEYYHEPSTIGRFLREKVLQTLLEDKIITSSKTLLTNEALDQFIRETYPEIIRRVPSKYIAQFIGITPESYSRLLKRQLQKS